MIRRCSLEAVASCGAAATLRRLVSRALVALLTTLALTPACTTREPAAPGPTRADASPADASTTGLDAEPARDATTMDASAPADATVGQACTFNDDCAPAERCACSGGACACAVGPRGTLAPGASPCATGDDCASAVCLEGPGDVLTCSRACVDDVDCPAVLPRCLTVPTVGRLCVRDPAARPDAGTSDDAGVAGCTGACASTTLAATFGPRRGDFERAQHGLAGANGVRIEAHFGGDPACPTEQSPTPSRTLILVGLTTDVRVQTEADGLRATLLDFQGTLTSAPAARATAVRLTPRHVEAGVAVSYTLEATFPEGTITGGLFAPHCTSLDE